VVGSYPGRQKVDGFFFSQRQEWDANGAALWTMAHHWRLTRDLGLVEPMVGPIAKGVHWIERKRHSKRRPERRTHERLAGLLPAGVSAEHLGPYDYFYWDDFWGVAGMRAGAELLRAAEQPEAAAEAERFAAAMWADVEASLDRTAKWLGTTAMPAGPLRRIDPGVIGSLVACSPLGLLPADDDRIAATADVIRDRFTQVGGNAFYQGISHTGLGTYLTMQLAAVELAAGDSRCLGRLAWMLEVATGTWTWPEAVHPRLAGGCMGDGHHGWAAADFLSLVRMLLVREVDGAEGGSAGVVGGSGRAGAADGGAGAAGGGAGGGAGAGAGAGLALSSAVPDTWLGQGWEVHDAPTAHGRLSYAVRWHGERPALLWELTPHAAANGTAPAPVRLTVPGLDPSWSSTELSGEALLAPVQRAQPAPAVEDQQGSLS
jgi:hypothetical protein